MHFQHLIDVLHAGARTGGDAAFATGIHQLWRLALGPRHGRNNCRLAQQLALIHAQRAQLFFHFAHARQHAQHARHAAHGLHLLHLLGHILQRELAFFHARRNFFGFLRIHGLGGFFHQTDHIAHAENAIGDAARVKNFNLVNRLADAEDFNRHAGDMAH